MREYWDVHAYGSSELDWPQNAFIERLMPAVRGKRVLELGCGGGGLSARLAQSAAEVTAVDFSDAMLRSARARLGDVANLRFVQGDILDLELDQEFDVVCGIMVLHEIAQSDYARLIAMLKKHMAAGSFGYFQENSFFNPAFRLFRRQVVGRLGVPRFGSMDERPFDAARMAALCGGFRFCQRSGDSFVLFQMIHDYVIRLRWSRSTFVALDKIITASRLPQPIRRNFTYCQDVYFSDYQPRWDVLTARREQKLRSAE